MSRSCCGFVWLHITVTSEPSLKGITQQLSLKGWIWLFNYAAYMNQTILTEWNLNANEVSLARQWLVFLFLRALVLCFLFQQSVSLSSVLNRKSSEDAVWVETSARELFKSWNTWTDALSVKSGDLNHWRCNGSLEAGSQTSPVRRRVSFQPPVSVIKKEKKRGRESQSKGLGWGFRHVSPGVQTTLLVQFQTWITTSKWPLDSELRCKICCFNHPVCLKCDFNRDARVQFFNTAMK